MQPLNRLVLRFASVFISWLCVNLSIVECACMCFVRMYAREYLCVCVCFIV